MNSDYSDPPNFDDIVVKIKECPTLNEIMKLMNEVLPNWHVGCISEFSPDYKILETNWKRQCILQDKTPTQIMVISQMKTDNNHKLIRSFAEVFAASGFLVRTKSEIMKCPECEKAIPTLPFYENLVKMSPRYYPSKWSDTCIACQKEEKEDEDIGKE